MVGYKCRSITISARECKTAQAAAHRPVKCEVYPKPSLRFFAVQFAPWPNCFTIARNCTKTRQTAPREAGKTKRGSAIRLNGRIWQISCCVTCNQARLSFQGWRTMRRGRWTKCWKTKSLEPKTPRYSRSKHRRQRACPECPS
jgi:hypothetical protein